MSEFPSQQQQVPGSTGEMEPEPHDEMRGYEGRHLLAGKRALITGGDSGIGRAVTVAFAKEGADVAIAYLNEDADAEHTASLVEAEGRRAVLLRCDLSQEQQCEKVVDTTAEQLGGLDIVVNNIAYQNPVDGLEQLTTEQWDRTFRTNIYSYFWITRAALRHLPDGAAVINTSS